MERASSIKNLLFGNEFTSLDDKGRMTLSRRKREVLMPEFAMGIDESGRVFAAPSALVMRWHEMAMQMLPEESLFDEMCEALFANLHDGLTFDAQGRVTVPQDLRMAAGLEKEIAVLGRLDRLIIMSRSSYDIFRNSMEMDNDEDREIVHRRVMERVRSRIGQEER